MSSTRKGNYSPKSSHYVRKVAAKRGRSTGPWGKKSSKVPGGPYRSSSLCHRKRPYLVVFEWKKKTKGGDGFGSAGRKS